MIVCLNINGQTKGLCINEVMTRNVSGIIDDYGKHQPWIEIFNTTFAGIDIRSCYLTNNKAVLNKNLSVSARIKMMYHIPRGDAKTFIEPRQFILFWADKDGKKGNCHTNFTLEANKSNWIALYDANGYTLIDSVSIPPLNTDCSYARITDGGFVDSQNAKAWIIKTTDVTPGTNNRTLDEDVKVNKFKEHDPDGFGMTIIAMGIVFSALILLYFAFKLTGKIGCYLMQKNAVKAKGKYINRESGDNYAAMAMALHEYQSNIHDVENALLTIQRAKRNYSPWSSKIYTLRHTPKR